MTSRKNNIHLYRGYFDFSCTGPACPNNCCRITTWEICMDKDIHRHFEQLDDDFAKTVLDSVRYDDEKEIYLMKPSESGNCAMLNPQGLCEIHKRYGTDSLPLTCLHYPRRIYSFNGMLEWHLENSCPVVVEQFIMNGKFELQELYENIDSLTELSEPTAKSRMAFQIQKATISVLQTLDMPLNDKLLWLNLMFQKLGGKPIGEFEEKEVHDILESFLRKNPEKDETFPMLKNEFENMSADIKESCYKHWWNILKGAIKVEKGIPSHSLSQKLEEFHAMDISELFGSTIALKNKLLLPYLKENEQVFENYLIKNIFDIQFPTAFETYEDAYTALISGYILLQLWILALYHKQEQLTSEGVRDAIYYLHRRLSHNKDFQSYLSDYYESNKHINWATLATILY